MANATLEMVEVKANEIQAQEEVSITITQFHRDSMAVVEMRDSTGRANAKMLEFLYSHEKHFRVTTVSGKRENADLAITFRF